MRVDVGSFTKATATGNQDITIPVDLTAAASGTWAIMFYQSHTGAASAIWASYAGAMVGFVANGGGTIVNYVCSLQSQDNVPTTVTSRRMAAKCITYAEATGVSADYEADFVSFPTATTMRINWTTNNSSTHQIMYAIFSGLTGAKVVNWTTPTTNTTKAVTGVGFSPDLVLSAGIHSTTVASAATAAMSFGAFNKHGQQWANGWYSEDATATASTSRLQRTDACIVFPDSDPDSTMTLAHFAAMDPSDGFTIAQSVEVGSALQMMSLCMDGVSSKLGALIEPSATGLQEISSLQGFTPKGLFTSWVNNAGPLISPTSTACWGLGATDLTNQRMAMALDYDIVDPTQADSVWRDDSIYLAGDAGTAVVAKASYASSTTTSFTLSWSNRNSNREILYMLVGDAGTNTFPAMIDRGYTTTTATAYSNQKKVATLSSGRMIQLDHSTADGILYWSDDGVTWTFYATGGVVSGAINGSIYAYSDGSDRLAMTWKQSGTGGGRTNNSTYAAVGTVSGTTITWGTAVEVNNNSLSNYPDLVAHPEGAGGYVHVLFNYSTAGNSITYYRSSSVSGTTMTQNAAVALGTYSTSEYMFASIDIDLSTKRLHAAWASGAATTGNGIRYRTAAYSAGPTWTWDTEREVSTSYYVPNAAYPLICRWNPYNSKVVIAGYLRHSGGSDQYYVVEHADFSTAGSALLTEVYTAATQGYYGGMTIDTTTGDIYLVGVSESYRYIHYRKYTRSAGTWGSARLTDTGAGSNTYIPNLYTWYYGGSVHWIYQHGFSSPYTIKYDRVLTDVISYGQRWPRGNW